MAFVRLSNTDTRVPAKVSRIVPGRLVYIETAAPDSQVFALTPNTFALEQSDGSFQGYRGESFNEIGVKVGTDVSVAHDANDQYKVVVSRLPSMPTTKRSLLSKFGF